MEAEQNQITICRTTLKILYYSLIWPSRKTEMNPGKMFYIKVVLFILITSPHFFLLLMHLVTTLKYKLDIGVSEDVSFVVAFCGCYCNTFLLVQNQPKLALLLKDLSDFTQFGAPPNFENYKVKLNFWSLCAFLYAAFGSFIYNAVKLFQKAECEKNNFLKGIDDNCGFLTPVWLPKIINIYPMNYIAMFYVFFSTVMLIKAVLIISYLSMEITHYLVLRIKHMELMLTECFQKPENYDTQRKKVKKCLLYHIQILGLAERLDGCFSICMLSHLTMTAAICGCIEKQFIDNQNRICACIHVGGWILALFVACFGGQHLISASEQLPNNVWSLIWYESDVRLVKDLNFILMRSQRILAITAGPFGIVSYSLFVSVMKMSYSILCFLTK